MGWSSGVSYAAIPYSRRNRRQFPIQLQPRRRSWRAGPWAHLRGGARHSWMVDGRRTSKLPTVSARLVVWCHGQYLHWGLRLLILLSRCLLICPDDLGRLVSLLVNEARMQESLLSPAQRDVICLEFAHQTYDNDCYRAILATDAAFG